MKALSNIRYLGIDLDGTLLSSSKIIDEETKCYLTKLVERNIKIIFVSGRHLKDIIPYVSEMDFAQDTYVVSSDGLYIHDYSKNLIWEFDYLTKKDIIQFCEISKIENFSAISESHDYIVEPSILGRKIRKFKSFLKKEWSIISYFKNAAHIPSTNFEKIRVSYNLITPPVLDSLTSRYSCHIIDDMWLDVMSKGVNKLMALVKLEELGYISLPNLLYFGNDDNDKECFESLKYTVAMVDSKDYLKRLCYYVTDSCDNQGVLKALKVLIPIKE